MSHSFSHLLLATKPPPAARALMAAALEIQTPQALVAWLLERSEGRVIFTTGFGMEGCVLVDMLSKALQGRGATGAVHYLDTHFLFAETHALRETLAQRYPNIRFVNAGTSLTPEEQARVHGPELWKRDPGQCCALRKVAPMALLLEGAAAWVTAIRRSQSEARATISTVEWDDGFGVVKVSPLATWSRADVWAYAQANEVPYNELHDKGYPSIGCTHCTSSVEGATASDYSREGRWPSMRKTECGLHLKLDLDPDTRNRGVGLPMETQG
jgi:phosphoadenosine phosphosulfate reductase